jgi:hypothetical protein
MNAGINDIGSFKKIFKTMVQLERSKIKRDSSGFLMGANLG